MIVVQGPVLGLILLAQVTAEKRVSATSFSTITIQTFQAPWVHTVVATLCHCHYQC